MQRLKQNTRLRYEALESRLVLSGSPLGGDYTGNNSVGSEDVDLWISSFGSTTQTSADGNGDGVISAADYVIARDAIGGTRTPSPFVNLVVDGLGEAQESSSGAVFFRNNDFSKQSVAGVSPETGVPLFEPDFLAGDTVFDPEADEDFSTASVRIDPTMLGSYTLTFTYDANDLRLWTTEGWAGTTDVGGGRFQIPSGIAVTPADVHIDFQIEAIGGSPGFATEALQVDAVPDMGSTISDSVAYTIVNSGIGVDGNRDALIDFENNHDRQLLFWFNNDQEGQHPTDDEFEFENTLITTTDSTDNVITQTRDLEDFAPLRLLVDSLLLDNTFNTGGAGNAAPGQLSVSYNILLEESEGAEIRLFEEVNPGADVTEHVRDFGNATNQVTFTDFSNSLGPSFTEKFQLGELEGGINAFLFESLGRAFNSQLGVTPILVFETVVDYGNGRSTTNRQEVELDIRDFSALYTRWDVDYGANFGGAGADLRFNTNFTNFATPTTPTHQSQVVDAAFWSGDDTVVFVHGWNNSDRPGMDDKAATAETMFKRLYWQGFRGELVAFNWPTLVDAEAGINFFGLFEEQLSGLALSYNPSEFQAFRSGRALAEVLETYRGEGPDLNRVTLAAHSMGNVVAGEALKLWSDDFTNQDALVTNYIAMQGAVSAGAWGDDARDSDAVFPPFFDRPVPDLYRFWSHGRDGFNDPGLGLIDLWDGAGFSAENMINFYNEDDYALSWWDFNNDSKSLQIESTIWGLDYDFTAGAGGNVNTDTFDRVDDDPNPDIVTPLTLVSPINLPNDLRELGANAYEIIAFFSQAASRAIGMKPVAVGFSPWDTDVDITQLTNDILGGTDILINHSYQFGHDSSETWDFWTEFMEQAELPSTRFDRVMLAVSSLTSQSLAFLQSSVTTASEDADDVALAPASNSAVANDLKDSNLLLRNAPQRAEATDLEVDYALLEWAEQQEEIRATDELSINLEAALYS